VTIAHQLALSLYAEGSARTSPRSSSPHCSFALVLKFSHSSLHVFRDLRTAHPTKDVPPEPVEGFFSLSRCLLTPPQSFVFIQLRTLSFSGSQLFHVFPAACALLRRKPGVHPYVVIPRLFTVDCRLAAVGQSRAASSISFISPTYENKPRISCVSHTYAKTGGYTPTQKCRRADIPDFSPDISLFLAPSTAEGPARRSISEGGFPTPFPQPTQIRPQSPAHLPVHCADRPLFP
jgi:hypothetical protein